ncbi:hypothetical protein EG850_03300 [Gulosibacter macacae]|uniref:Alpha/beta hydrolase n=1 Tax=Gulosibacter macacae TaxID=2488791 RepID=A0A3P3VZG9_9MICO|nr:hypothetical protein [Gulosibacter macacae]RRJ87894.1 hypothetical protein EG850_03300 [Gulosibacter macacae]
MSRSRLLLTRVRRGLLLTDARLSFADDQVIAQWQERQREELARWQEWFQQLPAQVAQTPEARVRRMGWLRRIARSRIAMRRLRAVELRLPELQLPEVDLSELSLTQISTRLAAEFEPAKFHRRIMDAARFAASLGADSAIWVYWQTRSLVRLTPPPQLLAGDPSLPVVLLIQGWSTTWRFMEPIAEALDRAGYRVRMLPQLGRMTGSSDHLTELVMRYLQSHRELLPVVLVTHSRGGIIAKKLLQRDPEGEFVLGAVTLSAPFSGAKAARLIRAELPGLEAVTLLRPGSPALHELARETAANSRITTISPIVDEIVGSGGALPGARNLAVSSIGHNLLLAEPRVHRAVVAEVERIAAAARAH